MLTNIQKLLRKSNKKLFFKKTKLWLFFIFGLLLPTQLGKHFWPSFSYINGLRIDYLSPTLYLTDFLLLLLLITKRPKLEILKKNKKTLKFIVLILGLLVINYLKADVKLLFLYRFWQYAKIVLTAYLFIKITKSEKKQFIKGLLFSTIYTLFLAIKQITTQGSLQAIWWFLGERQFTINSPDVSTISFNGVKILRAYGTFSHPNSLAGFYLILFWLFLASNLWVGALLSAILIGLSFSKLIIIIFLFSLACWSLFKSKDCFFCRTIKIGLLSWLVFFSFALKGDAESIIKRVWSWQKTILYLASHPFGVGLGQYLNPSAFGSYQPVHNIGLLFLLETGLFGALLIFCFLKPIQKLFKSKLNYLLLLIIITGLFDHYWLTLPQNMLLFGVIIGYIIGSLPKSNTLD